MSTVFPIRTEQSLLARYEALIRVSQVIGAHRDPKELFRILANELARAVHFNFVGLFLYDESTNRVTTPLIETIHGLEFAIPDDLSPEDTITWWVYHHQQPVVIASREEEHRFPGMMEVFRRHAIESACVLPLTTAQRRLGSLGFGVERPNAYSEEEVRFLGLVADQVALAVDNALRDHEKQRDEMLLAVHPDDRASLQAAFDRAIRGHSEFRQEFRLVRPDGSVPCVLGIGHAVPADSGEFTECVGTTTDITGRKRSEEALRQQKEYFERLFELAPDAIVLRDRENRVLRVNREFTSLFGFIPEESVDRDLAELIVPEGLYQESAQLREPLEPGERVRAEVVRRRKDGSLLNVELVSSPVSAEGTDAQICTIYRDITQRKRSEEALHRSEGPDGQQAFAGIRALKDQLYEENVALRQEIDETSMFQEIVGKSAALREVLQKVETLAPTESTVLICGETGTGKELIARAIHKLSARRGYAFVKLNCAAIPSGLLESELFGHEKLADRGTVFLDEIGDIPLELQPKLLRVLQEREFERLGSSETRKTAARLIAATNRDLASLVQDQQFRSDLFDRLNVFPIRVPALRERPEDLPLLAQHFAELFSRRMRKTIRSIPRATMEAMVRYHWPGNVRELQNLIERAVILSSGGVLQVAASDLTARARAGSPATERVRGPKAPPPGREQILQALRETGGRVGGANGAAARLGLKRTTFIAYMKRLGVSPRTVINHF